MRSQATGSPNFDLILDILNGNDLDRTGSKSRAGFKSSTPKSKRRSSRSIGMMHSFEALRLETDTIPEEEEEEKDEHSEDPADGDDDASISLCRWMGSSQHSTHTLPPMYPPRLEGRSDSGTNFEDDANVLGDSFGSFEISIATLDTSCASFAEAWDKPSSPEVDFDLFPLPDRVANISIVSPNAVAA
uniref:Uncharacterized protein n=1 Tax=Craspedostauros australis TaxID=1486917 RepID=A0A7R9WQ24_9STRA